MRRIVLFMSCLVIGFGIGLNLESIAITINEINNKRVELLKKEEENEHPKVEEKIAEEELQEQQSMQSLEKINNSYQVEKARHFILKETKGEIENLIYIGDEAPSRINGQYYIFGILENKAIKEDSKFYVDKETFKVYEDSFKDKYFGEYRGI